MNFQKPLSHLIWAVVAAVIVELIKLAIVLTIIQMG
jgi:hypothetical protein